MPDEDSSNIRRVCEYHSFQLVDGEAGVRDSRLCLVKTGTKLSFSHEQHVVDDLQGQFSVVGCFVCWRGCVLDENFNRLDSKTVGRA
jgi:hypothetical protein